MLFTLHRQPRRDLTSAELHLADGIHGARRSLPFGTRHDLEQLELVRQPAKAPLAEGHELYVW